MNLPGLNNKGFSSLVMVVAVAVLVAIGGYLLYQSTNNPASQPSGSLSTKQVTGKPKVIGLMYYRQQAAIVEALKKGMIQLGYVVGKDIVYDEVKMIAGPNLDTDAKNAADKMMKDKVDVMFTTLEHSAKVALAETKVAGNNMPIVFTTRLHDPVSFGLVDSYKSSGNNSTGVSINLVPVIQKTLLFFKAINPNAKKIGLFTDGFMIPPNNSDQILKEIKAQAPSFGFSVVEYKTTKPPSQTGENWHEVADKIKPGEIDALIHLPVHFYDADPPGPGRSQEADEELLAERLHIPYESSSPEDMPSGGMFAFGDDYTVSAYQAAVMIQKILNGIKPEDIPIESGTKSLLILNLKRASEAGIQFPESMLSIANVKIDK